MGATWHHVAHTTDQRTSPSCYTGAIQKSLSLTNNIQEFSRKKSWENRPVCRRTPPQKKKNQDRKSSRRRQKNKRGDSKVESNDSPEIPDRGETSDIPGLPFGALHKQQTSN